MICSIILVPVAETHARLLNTKTWGKLSLISLLTVMSVLTKLLVNSDKKEIEKLHSSLGPPDRITEFQQGFDNWRIEWYGEKGYLFRNGVLQGDKIRAFSELRSGNSGVENYLEGEVTGCSSLNFCENLIALKLYRKTCFMVE
jgi:hypothetical protein